jgi:acyl-CoA synthetase
MLVVEGEAYTYSEMHARVVHLAAQLERGGLVAGDRVMWQLPNGLDGVLMHFACWRLGLVSVPVVHIYREHELRDLVEAVRPDAVASYPARSDRAPAAEMDAALSAAGHRPRLRLLSGGMLPGWQSIVTDPPVGPRPQLSGVPAGPDEPCLILFTSGSTARPKGVVHAGRALVAEAACWRRLYGFGYRDVFLTSAPLTHVTGLLCALVPVTFGGSLVLMDRWDKARTAEHGVTFSCGATVFLQGIVEEYESQPPLSGATQLAAAHRLPLFQCGGSMIPESLVDRADRVGIVVTRAYGGTETLTRCYSDPDAPLAERRHWDGTAEECSWVEAVDEQRRPFPPGVAGELRVLSYGRMLEYLDHADAPDAIDDMGWFYTGDVGIVDDSGRVKITGRIKDVVNRGGEKFSTAEIEELICRHAAVESAAVVGLPDARLGEQVAAFVQMRKDHRWPGEEELRQHLEDLRLARQKIPQSWTVVDRLPISSAGKVDKQALRRQSVKTTAESAAND